MAENSTWRIGSQNSDTNQLLVNRLILDVFADMKLIPESKRQEINPDSILKLISIKLSAEQEMEAGERFIKKVVNDDVLFNMMPPAILAFMYKETKNRTRGFTKKGTEQLHRLDKIGDRIDELAQQFHDNTGYYFADNSNISDVYDGYKEMFTVRIPELNNLRDLPKKPIFLENLEKLKALAKAYDRQWNLNKITERNAGKLEKRWDAVSKQLQDIKPSDNVLKTAANYKFLDQNGEEIPQFENWKGFTVKQYTPSYQPAKNSRLNQVVNLAKHDLNMRHTADFDKAIDSLDLQSELDEQVLLKLFEIDTADKVAKGVLEKPDQFTNPENLKNFIENLKENGGSISDAGFQNAMDRQVNKTYAFGERIKYKTGKSAGKTTGLFSKLFKPIQKIDKQAANREGAKNTPENKRKKRIQFFVRVLTTVASAAIVGAAITLIATTAAALAGISTAAALATIGVVTGIAVSVIQIRKWQKEQKNKGKDSDLAALLRDKRMVATLGTSALAAIAMIFGAAGLTQAAMALGFGALTVGGTNNAISMFKDAKSAGFSTTESVSWAIAMAGGAIAGAIAGRAAVNAGINAYNQANPENTLFQQKETTTEIKTAERTETQTVYTDKALNHAERIAKMWYQNDLHELQNRVDLINQYNADHGTNINPYRAIMLNADAGGQTFDTMEMHQDWDSPVSSNGKHTVFTKQWATDNKVSTSDIAELKNLFKADGSINPKGIDAAMRIDPLVSPKNEIGIVSAGDAPHYDGVLPQNSTDKFGEPVHNVYTKGESAFETKNITITEKYSIKQESYNPVKISWFAGMFGTRNKKTENKKRLFGRAGAFLDRTKKTEEIQKTVRVMYLTRAQAKKLNDLQARLTKLQANPAEHKTEIKRLQQELQTIKNSLGRPSDDVLETAKKYAFLREENPSAIQGNIEYYQPVPYKEYDLQPQIKKQSFFDRLFRRSR